MLFRSNDTATTEIYTLSLHDALPISAQIAKEKAQAEENAKKLSGVQVKISARAGANGRLFGAVTSQEISDALKEQYGIEIEKNKIIQSEPIKQFGTFEAKAKLGYEVSGTINILVIEQK